MTREQMRVAPGAEPHNGRYILDGHEPVACPDLVTWVRWFEDANRVVALTVVSDRPNVVVSTVFLGLDRRSRGGGDGPPLLFETKVLRGGGWEDDRRYATWDDAVAGHEAIVVAARARCATLTMTMTREQMKARLCAEIDAIDEADLPDFEGCAPLVWWEAPGWRCTTSEVIHNARLRRRQEACDHRYAHRNAWGVVCSTCGKTVRP